MKRREKKHIHKKKIRSLYVFYYTIGQDRELIKKEALAEDIKLLNLLKSVHPWAELYSHSYSKVVATFLNMIGWLEPIIEAARSPNRKTAIIAILDELMDGEYDESFNLLNSYTEDERGVFLAFFVATLKNLDALAAFRKSMDELIQEAAFDNEALFNAVLIDRTAVTHPIIAKKISMAELIEDDVFMTELAKSISRQRARRRRHLDETRMMIELIDDVIGIDSLTYEQVAESLIDDLQIFPDTGKDPVEALKKNVQKRRRSRGK
ncbi:MAG: hypothetical protein KJO60_04685 [Desulfofustis sp.]|nr:hypothetical protein [Desulfofustis sp.]NNK98495.1 hypothetical protein [Xanthomonadales bacterium]